MRIGDIPEDAADQQQDEDTQIELTVHRATSEVVDRCRSRPGLPSVTARLKYRATYVHSRARGVLDRGVGYVLTAYLPYREVAGEAGKQLSTETPVFLDRFG
jgi:hypothetical protein